MKWYVSTKGDMNAMVDCVMLSEESDKKRWADDWILPAIELGEVEKYPLLEKFLASAEYSEGSKKKKRKSMKINKAAKEALEAEDLMASILGRNSGTKRASREIVFPRRFAPRWVAQRVVIVLIANSLQQQQERSQRSQTSTT